MHSAGGHSSALWVPQQGADAEAWQRQERVNAAAAAAASGPLQLPSWPPPRYPAALHVVVSETRLQVGMLARAQLSLCRLQYLCPNGLGWQGTTSDLLHHNK